MKERQDEEIGELGRILRGGPERWCEKKPRRGNGKSG